MTLIFYDQFTSAGEVLTSHTPTDAGTGWTREVDASTGQPECLATGKLRWSTTPSSTGAAVSAQPDPATADVDVEITLSSLLTSNGAWSFGIFARWADSNNYYGVQIFPAAYATVDTRVFKKVSGSYTVLVSASSDVGWANGDVLKFELRGTTLKVYRNGSEILSVTDSALSAAGKAGVLWGNMTANGTSVASAWQSDNFKVTEVASGWSNIAKVNGVASSSLAKVNGVAVASISKINGVAV